MSITLDQYFIGRPHTSDQAGFAQILLAAVNALLAHYSTDEGVELPINPHTGTLISGKTEGGFRLPNCPQGAPNSSHKEAKAVDVYDPSDDIDTWLNDEILTQFNLYREAPASTLGWCHLTTRPPGSKHRTFEP
jgi:hypothetical protein